MFFFLRLFEKLKNFMFFLYLYFSNIFGLFSHVNTSEKIQKLTSKFHHASKSKITTTGSLIILTRRLRPWSSKLRIKFLDRIYLPQTLILGYLDDQPQSVQGPTWITWFTLFFKCNIGLKMVNEQKSAFKWKFRHRKL